MAKIDDALLALVKQKNGRFDIRVTPKASANKIIIKNSVEIRVYVTAVQDKGKANKAVIELLSRALAIAKTQIEIERGHMSRSKTIFIKNLSSHPHY